MSRWGVATLKPGLRKGLNLFISRKLSYIRLTITTNPGRGFLLTIPLIFIVNSLNWGKNRLKMPYPDVTISKHLGYSFVFRVKNKA
jgi:hypothetical protein